MVGSGYPSCFDDPSEEMSVECPSDSTRCQTDMSVEWYFMGEQMVHMKRGCATKEKGCFLTINFRKDFFYPF